MILGRKHPVVTCTVLCVLAAVAAYMVFRPQPGLVDQSRSTFERAIAGDCNAIIQSIAEDDLQRCRLTKENWREIAVRVIAPELTFWGIKSLRSSILTNRDTLGYAEFVLVDNKGREAYSGVPMFETGEQPITTVEYWILTVTLLRGIRELPSNLRLSQQQIQSRGLGSLLPDLRACGFTGYSDMNRVFHRY